MLNIWTVYDSPADYPGRYIARKWILDKPTDEVLEDITLEGLRAKIPHGLVCMPRQPEDEPQIVETWL